MKPATVSWSGIAPNLLGVAPGDMAHARNAAISASTLTAAICSSVSSASLETSRDVRNSSKKWINGTRAR
jgi:hypothetical protein